MCVVLTAATPVLQVVVVTSIKHPDSPNTRPTNTTRHSIPAIHMGVALLLRLGLYSHFFGLLFPARFRLRDGEPLPI